MTIFGVSLKFYGWMLVTLAFAMGAEALQSSPVSIPLIAATLVCYVKGWMVVL